MKKQLCILTAALSCGLLALSGCSAIPRGEGFQEAESTENPSVAQSIAEEEAEASEQELYNLYIDINNSAIGRVNDSLTRYFNYVLFQEEFALQYPEDNYMDCYDVSSLMEDVEEAYSLASAKTQPDVLDQSYLALYPVLKDLMEVLSDVAEYSDMKTYLDDGFAKSREYHAKIWTDYAAYEPLLNNFMSQLEIIEQQKNEETLNLLKEEGLVALYSINSMINSAQNLQMEFYNQGITDDNILEVNLEAVQPLYDQFAADVQAVLDYSDDEELLKTEGIPVHTAYWNTFLRNMKDAKTSMTEVMDHIRNGEPTTSYGSVISLPGNPSLASFESGLSGMIDNYNYMISY